MSRAQKDLNQQQHAPSSHPNEGTMGPTDNQNNIILYLNHLLENMSDAFIAINMSFKIVNWNRAAHVMYGWTAEEVLGQSIAEVIPTEYIQGDSKQAFQKIMNEGVWSDKVFQLRKDGSRIAVYATVSLVKDAAGGVVGLAAVNRDITESRQAEERFRRTVESAPNAILLVDPNGQIVLANSQSEKYFGYRKEELLGRVIDQLVPQRFAESHANHRAGFTSNPQMRVMGAGRELYALRSNGTEFPVEIGLVPIDMHDGTYVMATIVDITARKKSEEELRRLNRELEAFSYSVSHDLRAPLRGIDGFSGMLKLKYGNVLDEQGNHYLSRIQANIKHMAEMIDQLLLLAKMTSQSIKPGHANLSLLATEVFNELLAEEAGREVRFEVEEQIEAYCDAGLMRVVLQNLLSNALKFTSKQDVALIQMGRQARDTAGRTIYFIRDNGVGFDMAHAEKLFTAFQRLHTENEFSGTGIGLATVQRIIHRHGGSIWAEAAPGNGATFFFTLGDLHE